MAALQPTRVCGLIQVAREAGLIRFSGTKFGGISDVFGRSRFSVLACRAMAGLTCLPDAAIFLLRFYGTMRTFSEGVENILMAGLTYLGPDIFGRATCRRRTRLLTIEREGECTALGDRS